MKSWVKSDISLHFELYTSVQYVIAGSLSHCLLLFIFQELSKQIEIIGEEKQKLSSEAQEIQAKLQEEINRISQVYHIVKTFFQNLPKCGQYLSNTHARI
jgi:hypothetical protein